MKAATVYFAPSELLVFLWAFPGALPQAITFRAVGASCRLEFELIVVRFVAKETTLQVQTTCSVELYNTQSRVAKKLRVLSTRLLQSTLLP